MIIFDVAALAATIARLEEEIASPSFWDNPTYARKVMQNLEQHRSRFTRYQTFRDELQEIDTLYQIATDLNEDDEIEGLIAQLADLEKRLRLFQIEVFLSGPYDRNDCYLSINAGAGGTDSQDWAAMLLRMFGRWCERSGFTAKLLTASPGEMAGIKSATLEINGDYAFGYLKQEKGVHRLVRLSPFDTAHRRHTSFAAVTVIPQIETGEVNILSDDLRIDTYRSSGAGGQHVNVTDSAVRITHLPTGIVVSCQNERSQHQNKEIAMKVLHSRLAELLYKQQTQRLEELQGKLEENEWGSQIRSYILHPYRLVKDHRTGLETGNVDAVLDGELTSFIEAMITDSDRGK
ncbi:peptide chain release factor 2 [Candidatus Acetothermia bacterium]|nr:peptide chain release factor 2 [Candidatus Acetothermia bacterium]MCI2427378.1 peptide chain release factor 2 [Candidatus Acetothermia bacterium]MCI2428715.1 peptide chain release factor 2 [Candidatus Acetothermia bacterium]